MFNPTIFENSSIPLQKWFAAVWLITSHKKGISSLQLSRDIGITQKSAWFVLQRIRFAIRTRSFNVPLTNIVEADETYTGGKNKNRHTNTIEGFWPFFKRGIVGNVSEKHFNSYIDEFEYRYNTKHLECSERFNDMISMISSRLSYSQLIAE